MNPMELEHWKLFFVYRDQTRRIMLPVDSVNMDLLRFTFEHAFAVQFSDRTKIYVKDEISSIFYELEHLHDLSDGSVLKLQELQDHIHTCTDPSGTSRSILEGSSYILTSTCLEVAAARSIDRGEIEAKLDRALAELEVVSAKLSSLKLEQQSQASPRQAHGSAANDPSGAPNTRRNGQSANNGTAGERAGKVTRVQGSPTELDRIRKLRLEIGQLKNFYTAFSKEQTKLLDALRTQLQFYFKDAVTVSSLARSKLLADKREMDSGRTAVQQKIQELTDFVEEMKLDVTKRKSKPSEALMSHVLAESFSARTQLDQLLDFIAEVKPSWATVWEEELQNIVQEQSFLKAVEDGFDDLEDDLSQLLEVIQSLQQIVELQTKTKAQAMTQGLRLPVGSPSDGELPLDSLFQEISAVVPDSSRRMRALQLAEKTRLAVVTNNTNEFDQELRDFVSKQRFKSSGRLEQLERERAERDKQVLLGVYASPTDADNERPPSSASSSAISDRSSTLTEEDILS